MVVQHVEHDLQGDLGEDGHHAGHDDLTGHPGNGPIFLKVWTLIISASELLLHTVGTFQHHDGDIIDGFPQQGLLRAQFHLTDIHCFHEIQKLYSGVTDVGNQATI